MAPTPRPTALTPRADRSFVRSIAATGIAQVTKSVATKVLAEHWPDDSYLRRAVRLEKRLFTIHIADSLRRLLPRTQIEKLGRLLLDLAYGELPKYIMIANDVRKP